LYFRANDTCSI